MASRIIALNGAAGSGKSAAARFLIGMDFEPTKFARPLKQMLASFYEASGLMDPCDIERRIEGDLKEVPDPYLNGKSPRWAMQSLGTEWGRDCLSPDLWVDAWVRKVSAIPGPVVVDDCRFENEAAAIHRLGGMIVRVSRESPEAGSTHVSEAGLPEGFVDVTINNSGSIADLHRNIASLV